MKKCLFFLFTCSFIGSIFGYNFNYMDRNSKPQVNKMNLILVNYVSDAGLQVKQVWQDGGNPLDSASLIIPNRYNITIGRYTPGVYNPTSNRALLLTLNTSLIGLGQGTYYLRQEIAFPGIENPINIKQKIDADGKNAAISFSVREKNDQYVPWIPLDNIKKQPYKTNIKSNGGFFSKTREYQIIITNKINDPTVPTDPDTVYIVVVDPRIPFGSSF